MELGELSRFKVSSGEGKIGRGFCSINLRGRRKRGRAMKLKLFGTLLCKSDSRNQKFVKDGFANGGSL